MSQQKILRQKAGKLSLYWEGIRNKIGEDPDFRPEEFSSELYDNVDLEREAAMRAKAWGQINDLMGEDHNWKTEDLKSTGIKVGPEVEYQVLKKDDGEFSMVIDGLKDEIMGQAEDVTDTEVGATAIESHSEPEIIRDLNSLAKMIQTSENEILTQAGRKGAGLLRLGTIPFEFDDLERTDEEKYKTVPEFHNKIEASGEVGEIGLKVEDAALAGSIFSSQLNLKVPGLEEGLEMLKHSYAWQPYGVRLSGSSRFFRGKDLGNPSNRNDIWNETHDLGEGEEEYIGEMSEYPDDILEYFSETIDRPFILNTEDHEEAAREVAEGIHWKDSRLKLDEENDEVVLEFRGPGIQPTTLEDAAVHAFVTGRTLYGSFWHGEPLDIDKVNENRRRAFEGSNEMYDSEGELRNIGFLSKEEEGMSEIDKAQIGLEMVGLNHEIDISEEKLLEMGFDTHEIEYIETMNSYLDILRDRVYDPSEFDYAAGNKPEIVTPSDEIAYLDDGDLAQTLEEIGAFKEYNSS